MFHWMDTPFHASTHLLTDTWVASTFWLLWIMSYEHGCTGISLSPCFHSFWEYIQAQICFWEVLLDTLCSSWVAAEKSNSENLWNLSKCESKCPHTWPSVMWNGDFSSPYNSKGEWCQLGERLAKGMPLLGSQQSEKSWMPLLLARCLLIFLNWQRMPLDGEVKKSIACKRVESSRWSSIGEHSHKGLKPVFVARSDVTNARVATNPHSAPLWE